MCCYKYLSKYSKVIYITVHFTLTGVTLLINMKCVYGNSVVYMNYNQVPITQSPSDASIASFRNAGTLADINVVQKKFLFILSDRKRNVAAPDALISSSHSIHDPSFTVFLLHHLPFSSHFLTLSFHFNTPNSFSTITDINWCQLNFFVLCIPLDAYGVEALITSLTSVP